MRKFLVLAVMSLATLILVLFWAGLALAENGTFRPGSLAFPLQATAERVRSSLTIDPYSLAYWKLTLLERRTSDLAAKGGTGSETLALEALNQEVDETAEALSRLNETDPERISELKALFSNLLGRAESIAQTVQRLSGVQDTDLLQRLITKLTTLQSMLTDPRVALKDLPQVLQALVPSTQSNSIPQPTTGPAVPTIDPVLVMFPPGSAGARHEFYPLVGKHATLRCQACHPIGQYKGTSKACVDCHVDVKPTSHYPGDCAACHTPDSWQEVHFDHSIAKATDCLSCHVKDKPADHWQDQCSNCHNTNAWQPASFNHATVGAKDCLSCHSKDKPANHWQVQCSSCHNTDAWKPASFDHAAVGAKDCLSCHSKDKPANHWQGQCSSCHNTNAWKPASFNHAAVGATDCQSCHNRPSNHFGEQCSSCHNTNAWKPASFNHAAVGATDCQSCHNRPSNHYSGQCSSCHNTDAWRPASFNHAAAGATDCQGCHNRPSNHYSGQCSSCHNTGAWRPASFNHAAAGATDCQGCHNRPSNHYSGQCSSCHNTDAWKPASFSHSFPVNHGGANGDCGKCHPSGGSAWTCYTCHDQQETEKHHAEKNINDIASRCLECHPNGKGD